MTCVCVQLTNTLHTAAATPRRGNPPEESPDGGLDVGLVSSLTKRLTALERLCGEQRAYITAKVCARVCIVCIW
jgi:hypothetical protein